MCIFLPNINAYRKKNNNKKLLFLFISYFAYILKSNRKLKPKIFKMHFKIII